MSGPVCDKDERTVSDGRHPGHAEAAGRAERSGSCSPAQVQEDAGHEHGKAGDADTDHRGDPGTRKD